MELTSTQIGLFFLFDEIKQDLILKTVLGLQEDFTDLRLKIGDGFAGETALTGQPKLLYIEKGEFDLKVSKDKEEEIRSIICLPVKVNEVVIAVAEIASKDTLSFIGPEEFDILCEFCNHAGRLINDCMVIKRQHTEIKRLNRLLEITKVLGSGKSLNSTLEATIRVIKEVLKAEVVSIFLLDQDEASSEDRFSFEVFQKIGDSDVRVFRKNPNEVFAGGVIKSQEAFFIKNIKDDKDSDKMIELYRDFIESSLMSVPLIFKQRPIGVIEIVNKKNKGDFTIKDLEYLCALAAQLAVIIENKKALKN
jgi:GAF domain-containing protein